LHVKGQSEGFAILLEVVHRITGASSQVECTTSQFLMTSSEELSTLSGVLGAVGSVARKSAAVGGHNGIDEVLQLPDAR
jgi:hypothetical protein